MAGTRRDASRSKGRGRTLILAASLIALSGCITDGFMPGGDTYAWTKPNTTRAQRRLDINECTLAAAREVPPVMGTEIVPGIYDPGPVFCTGAGFFMTCSQSMGMSIPPMAVPVDYNVKLRQKYVDVCLQKKGYALAKVKFCQSKDDLVTEDCVSADKL
ncbi:hypothetical protein [Segnochrobactrum spirostomi]|uniref:Lipoprotein n=1 Tax=Segnochrobactrum spirostomi TaxID=2608987 RepID=A0A6A7Y7P0_9HYPH|nr:hypothetical protein [Segnochrobactrum spirostomi]MQT14008.1 hypothetical protein [Segnochrobactrum spirostomi]